MCVGLSARVVAVNKEIGKHQVMFADFLLH